MIDLVVCDRIKQSLPESVLRYVLSLESSLEGSWMPLKDLVSNLDIYVDTHNDDHRPRSVISAVGGSGGFKSNARPPRPPPPKFENKQNQVQNNGKSAAVKRCFVCNSPNHLRIFINQMIGSELQCQLMHA